MRNLKKSAIRSVVVFAIAAPLLAIFQNCAGSFGAMSLTGTSESSSYSKFADSIDGLPAESILPAKPFTLATVIETNPGGLPTGYHYAPSISYDNGKFHMFFCGTGDPNGSWDFIRYRSSVDGKKWTDEQMILAAADGRRSADRSACDPSVVKFKAPGDTQPYFYLYYTGNEREAYCDNPASPGYQKPSPESCGQGLIFVARSKKMTGPYEKYMGANRWETWTSPAYGTNDMPTTSLTTLNPQPILRRKNSGGDVMSPHSYGAGQSTVVIRGGTLHMWFWDDSGSMPGQGYVYHSQSTDGVSWSAAVPTDVRYGNSMEVKWDPTINKYRMFSLLAYKNGAWVDGNHTTGTVVATRTSNDGLTWTAPQVVQANRAELDWANNIGVGSDITGTLDPSFTMIAYGANPRIPGTKCVNGIGCWAQWNIDALLLGGAPVPMHRIYNPNGSGHVFTSNPVEADALVSFGWRREPANFNVYRMGLEGQAEVWRLSHPSLGLQYYTTTTAERDGLIAAGWNFSRTEGFLWQRQRPDTVEVLHAYNPNAGHHMFTSDVGEYNALIAAGWQRNNSLGWAPTR